MDFIDPRGDTVSEQYSKQAPTRRRRSNQAGQQNSKQVPTLQRPSNADKEAWKTYWMYNRQPWRKEPEIDVERQQYLAKRRAIMPDIVQGIYPFKESKLTRADVEWLLATHENGRGPVDWSEVSQRERWGLDLRGADLCRVKLHNLPLARLRGGLTWDEWLAATDEQREMAGVKLTGSYLFRTHLEGARLRKAHLEEAYFNLAHLDEAYLEEAYLERSNLFRAHLEGANLIGANLDYAILYRAIFDSETRLDQVSFGKTSFCTALLADVSWGGVSLANLNWPQVKMLGDEHLARQKEPDKSYFFVEWQKISSSRQLKTKQGKSKDRHLDDYMSAVRANRQLAVTLQEQGLNEVAARFAYRAQLLQRKVFWYQRKFGQYLFSLFLDLLAGYGYKPWRSFVAYLIVILGFAISYYTIGHAVGPSLSPLGSFIFSMTSFHGRGFFPGGIKLDDPLTVLAAMEAFVGLLIEVTFIATLTQRLFGK